jgi:hypothetical protein
MRSAFVACACAITMLQVARAQGPQTRPVARTTASSAAVKLPVRRVVLFKNGVGYFEHVGHVRGNQSLSVDFNTAQLNDVLKSLTTLDLGDGRIADVSFNSEAPFAQRLGALTLPVGERTTPFELLSSLRGARLEVRSGDRLISGRLLSVERRPRKDEAPHDVLTLVTDAGEMRSVELTPAVSVKLAERDSAEQVSAYLGLLASNRSQDHRRMTIAAVGNGARDVLVSYVSEVPVWKTNYRLVLPRGGGTPTLQGWAIVDNTIGEDWNDVELSLVAGAPQSFVQPLSQPLYTRRPVVGLARVNLQSPQIHQETMTERGAESGGFLAGRVIDPQGAVLPGVTVTAIDGAGGRFSVFTDGQGCFTVAGRPTGTYRLEFNLVGFRTVVMDGIQLDGTARSIQDVLMQMGQMSETVLVTGTAPRIDVSQSRTRGAGGGIGGGVTGGIVGGLTPPPPPAASIDRAAVEERLNDMQVAAQGQSLGDLFEYRVGGTVTIHKNQSALVPILKAEVGIERVSVWNDRVGGPRPLRSVWLTNSSGLTLDAGSFTLLEESTFAGEGLLDSIKPGEKRLLSYAIDLGVQVDSRRGDEQRRVSRLSIARGIVVQHSDQTTRRVYTIRNSDTTARTVVIEHPVRPGWTLVKGAVPVETSLGSYRFAIPVAAKGTATLEVEERHPIEANYSISQLTDQQVAIFVHDSRENVSLSQALGPIQVQKSAIAATEAEIEARQTEADRIADDQKRLRENMGALKGGAGEQQLLKRYVSQLNLQEDRIAALRRETADLEQRLSREQAALETLIKALALDVDVLEAEAEDDARSDLERGTPSPL